VIRRRLAFVGLLVLGAAVGSFATITVWGGSSAAVPAPPPVTTATVMRTDLVTTTLTEGTLGYSPTDPVVNRMTGTYTELPASGTTVQRGDVLYRVDDQPTVLMFGPTPSWRSLALGVNDGPDVLELKSNLMALGHAGGLFTTASSHFDSLTALAVERWQSAHGYLPDGQVALGQIVFLPGPVLVGSPNVARGQPASPGSIPYQATTATRIVAVPLTPNLLSVAVGERVSIVLASNTTTGGTITAVGPAPTSGNPASAGSTTGGTTSGGSDQSQASALATVTPDQPGTTGTGAGVPVQVSLTVQSASNVLAAPIAALLALAGGGYGVEVVGPSGVHHVVGVTMGVFSGSQVQINGAGVQAGTRVVVAQ
jgi:hypothetical protein